MSKRYTEEQNKQWRANLPKKLVAVKVIIKSDKGNILLVKPDYKDTWQLPGGGVDANEAPEIAAIREAEEEAGIDLVPNDLQLKDTIFKPAEDQLFLMYECRKVFPEDGDYSVEDEEIEAYKFIEPHQIIRLLPSYYHDFLNKYLV